MPDFSIQVLNLVATDEWTAVEFIVRGTHTGPLSGPKGTIAPTEKRLQFECCEFLRITDGQISESHLYFDTSSSLLQPAVALQEPMAYGRYA